jgi:hypothetical protein
MATTDMYINERLDHLGLVAGVCQEIGLAAWLDAQDPGNRKPGELGNGNARHGAQWVGVQALVRLLLAVFGSVSTYPCP